MKLHEFFNSLFNGATAIATVAVAILAWQVANSPTGDRLVAELRSDIVDSRAEKLALQTDLQTLRTQVAAIDAERGRLEAEVKSLPQQTEKLREERDTLNNALLALAGEKRDLTLQTGSLRKQYAEYIRRIEGLIVRDVAQKITESLKPYRENSELAEQIPQAYAYIELLGPREPEMQALKKQNTPEATEKMLAILEVLLDAEPMFMKEDHLYLLARNRDEPPSEYTKESSEEFARRSLRNARKHLTVSPKDSLPTGMSEFVQILDSGPLELLQQPEQDEFRSRLISFANSYKDLLSDWLQPVLRESWTVDEVLPEASRSKRAQENAAKFRDLLLTEFRSID